PPMFFLSRLKRRLRLAAGAVFLLCLAGISDVTHRSRHCQRRRRVAPAQIRTHSGATRGQTIRSRKCFNAGSAQNARGWPTRAPRRVVRAWGILASGGLLIGPPASQSTGKCRVYIRYSPLRGSHMLGRGGARFGGTIWRGLSPIQEQGPTLALVVHPLLDSAATRTSALDAP